MATYKLIQDVEAEDHILGPLSFRQFVFGLIAAFLGYVCFLVIVKHVAFLLAIFLPPALFCAFFAFPWGGDQPTETWALAKLRFWFKPRRRIWDQSGLKELVTITVPKKVERVYTDGLSQGEVKSRLQALANTIDSRGWAIKHINAIGYLPAQTDSERLLDIPVVPAEASELANAADDIMDAVHNPVAQQFDDMIIKSSEDRRQRLIEELQRPAPPAPSTTDSASQWFMNHNPTPATPPPAQTAAAPAIPFMPVAPAPPAPVGPQAAADDSADAQLLQQAGENRIRSNLRTLQPLSPQTTSITPAASTPPQPMTDGGDPAILTLSKNNDLNVATLAREARRAKGDAQDEVVISLH